jgi:hypothetical protein
MTKYTLTASLHGRVSRKTIYADDTMDATCEAITVMMRKAMTSELWAMGRIRLAGPDGIVHESAAKVT